MGISCCGSWAVRHVDLSSQRADSVAAALGHQSTGSIAVVHMGLVALWPVGSS